MGRQDRRAPSPHPAILSRRGLRGRHRARYRPLSGMDAAARARHHGQARHRARHRCRSRNPASDFYRDKAAAFARRCNDYSAELIAQHPKRFGCFGLVPMHDIDAAIAEARYCLETLRFEGVCLFASYGEKFLGDTAFDPLMPISTAATRSSTSIRACIRRASRSRCHGRAS